jgi:protein SCO1/2
MVPERSRRVKSPARRALPRYNEPMSRPTVALLTALLLPAACGAPSQPAQVASYPLRGQVLAVNTERREMTVKHEDIDGFMMGMTMTFPVATPGDLAVATPGDLITATLEVTNSQGRLVNVVRTGSAPLPGNTNEVALASGILEPGDAVPDAALIDQADRRRSLSEWQGFATVYSFVYTTCPLPTFCPLIDRHFVAAQQAIAADPALRAKARLVSISIDPARDSPAVLAEHAGRLGVDPAIWTLLTGDVATVDRVAGRFGVGIVRPDTPGEIKHNLRTTVVGPDGHVRQILSGNEWTPADLLAEVRAAAAVR